MSKWTKERHEAAKARCQAATPGPWGTTGKAYVVAPGQGGTWEIIFDYTSPDRYGQWQNDCSFVAHANVDLPDALDEIERLQAIERLAWQLMNALEADEPLTLYSEEVMSELTQKIIKDHTASSATQSGG